MSDPAKPVRNSRRPASDPSIPESESWPTAVLEAVKTMRYGIVQITVQDSKISLIERIDRSRLEVPPKGEPTPP